LEYAASASRRIMVLEVPGKGSTGSIGERRHGVKAGGGQIIWRV
jgi:hypothetical protein